jgi:endonuclease YncB( thermonuclease family)
MGGGPADWAHIGAMRVIDGDGVEWNGKKYRLEGYDAPETHNIHSKHSKGLEWTRGVKAMHRLVVLIRQARSVHLVPGPAPTAGRDRYPAVLLIDGRDIAEIAKREGWGREYWSGRKPVDWGLRETPFPDHLPMPPGITEYEDD